MYTYMYITSQDQSSHTAKAMTFWKQFPRLSKTAYFFIYKALMFGYKLQLLEATTQ